MFRLLSGLVEKANKQPAMSNHDSPLTDDEIEFLDRFLIDRIDEDKETPESNVGILCVSELDGFLTAIVSGPTMVMPSQWMPAVWEEFPPEFETARDADRIMSLIMRHMNSIARHLMADPDSFEPMFLERDWNGRTVLVVDEWCEGYVRALSLSSDDWKAGGTTIASHLANILAFSEAGGWIGHEAGSHAEVERRQLEIIPSAREIHAYWLERRRENFSVQRDTPTPRRRAQSRVGRNDPCPCGSGRKYKKCCLH